jgi:hypothetical protein
MGPHGMVLHLVEKFDDIASSYERRRDRAPSWSDFSVEQLPYVLTRFKL